MNEDVDCLEPLNCHMCGFECFSQNELKTHMRIHSGFKPFMCTICNEKFSQKSNLERHCSFYHGGRSHGQTSHIDTKSVETGVLTGGISGTKKEDVHSGNIVTVRKRGRPRKTEDKNIDQIFDDSTDTEDFICLSDQVTNTNVQDYNKKKCVQARGMNKEDNHSDTARCKRGRPRKNENKTVLSKLENSTEEVICHNVTTATVEGGHTNSLQCYICFKQFLWFDDLQAHLSIHTEEKLYVCPVCKCGFREWDSLKTHFLTHIGSDKEMTEDKETKQLESPINLEKKTVSISETESVGLPSKLSEKLADGTLESSVCKYCKTGFVDAKFLDSHSKTHLSEKPWTCNHCQESFHDATSLRSHHRNSHTAEKHWICDMCKTRFKSTCGLNRHLLIHAGKKSFICNICGKGFTHRQSLQTHTRTHTGVRPFKCNICSKGFNHKGRFQLHMKSHIGEKLRKISVDEPSTSTRHETPKPLEFEGNCEKKLANVSEGILPLPRTNEKRKSLICYCCKTGFTKTNTLELHLKEHTLENPWLCNNCQESFPKQDALKCHRRIAHTAENDWICIDCRKRFKTDGSLNQHLMLHIGKKPFKCNICNKGFNQKVNLKIHHRVHTGEKLYMCTLCNKRFKSPKWFKNHGQTCKLKSVKSRTGGNLEIRQGAIIVDLEQEVDKESSEPLHNKIIEPQVEDNMAARADVQNKTPNPDMFDKSTICNFCKTGFLELKALKMHIESSHRGQNLRICNHCHEKFQNQLKLKSHQRLSHTGEKHWICHMCKKRFRGRSQLNSHLFFHTGERPYKCNICQIGFNQISNLSVHQSRVHRGEKPYICGFCHQRFKYINRFKRHARICLPKTHESSESFFEEEANGNDEEVRLNELSDEKSACEIQVTKVVHEFSNDGLENLSSNTSGDSYTQTLCFSSSLSSSVNTNTEIFQNQFDIIEIASHLSLHTGKKSYDNFRTHSPTLTGENFESETVSISENVVSPLKLYEKSADDTSSKTPICNYCKTGFPDPTFLESHSKGHSSEKPWTCNHCQESFHEETSLKSHHRNSHTGEKHWICYMCKTRYSGIRDLNHHLFVHAGKKPFKCKICDKGFTQKANLRVHTMAHSRKERFKCNICSRGFNHMQKLQFHMNSHNGEKKTKLLFKRRAASGDEPSILTRDETPEPLQFHGNCESKMAKKSEMTEKRESLICNCCKTGFTKTSTLELHSRTHTDENPWLCNNCKESFLKQKALISHRRVSHAGEKDWICHECGKRFKTTGNLNQHLMIHTGKYPFKCDICGKGFNQKVNVQIHKRVHTGEEPYMCTVCNQRFKFADAFKRHGPRCKLKLVECQTGVNSKIRPESIIIDSEKQVDKESSEPHHNKIMEPQAENKMAIADVQNKKSTNPFHKSTMCIYCKTGFLQAETLKMHIESCHTGESPWFCNHCQRKFQSQVKLKSHHRIWHTGVNHWICHKCKKRFKSRLDLLNRHLIIHTGPKPYQCNICKKRFNQITTLRTHSRVHAGDKPFICGVCQERFKCKTGFKRHVQKCLPKTHESSESLFGEKENVAKEELCLNEISDEKSVRKIHLTAIVPRFTIHGSENRAPKVSSDINTQKPCCSSSLSSQANTSTDNDEYQFDKIEIAEKSSEPKLLKQSADIDTTTCSKLSEENRSQEWTSFLEVFNVKVARKF